MATNGSGNAQGPPGAMLPSTKDNTVFNGAPVASGAMLGGASLAPSAALTGGPRTPSGRGAPAASLIGSLAAGVARQQQQQQQQGTGAQRQGGGGGRGGMGTAAAATTGGLRERERQGQEEGGGATPAETIAFLEDTVRRLHAELGRWQLKYPGGLNSPRNGDQDDSDDGGEAVDQGLPLWMKDPKAVSPLFRAYDNKISTLESQLSRCKEEVSKLETQVQDVIGENESLMKQLKNAYGGFQDDTEPRPTLETWRELQNRLQILEEENEVFFQQQQLKVSEHAEALKELQDLTSKYDQARAKLHQLQSRAADLEQARSQISLLERKRNSLEEQLRSCKSDSAALAALRIEFEQLKTQKDALQQENQELLSREHGLSSGAATAERKIAALTEQRDSLQRELRMANADRDELYKSIESLEKRIASSEQREAASLRRMNECEEQVEEAKLEHQKAVLSEQKALAEAQKATEQFSVETEKLKEHYTAELGTYKAQADAKTSRLQNEINELQVSNATLTAEIDRRKREKRSLELELDRLHKVPETELQNYRSRLDEADSRLAAVIREKDTAVINAQRVENDLAKVNKSSLQDKEQLNMQIQELQQRIRAHEQTIQAQKNEIQNTTESIDQLENDLKSAISEKEASERSLLSEKDLTTKSLQSQIQNLQQRLEESEVSRKQALEQHNTIVSSQTSMRAKWKEDLQSTTARFQKALKEIEFQKAKLQDQNEALSLQLTQLSAQRNSHSMQDSEFRRTVEKYQKKYEMAERNLAQLAGREQEYIQSQQVLVSEHAKVSAERDQLLAERDRLRRDLRETSMELQQQQTPHQALQSSMNSLRLQRDQALERVAMLEALVARLRDEKHQLTSKLRALPLGGF
ncbi:sodium channel and clathrin linker 1 [Pelomyxa schiedti]|nr:sodium channel and clathrin linker 1 [Pelomyxa schiedti]